MKVKLWLLSPCLLFAATVFARPEYALRYNNNRCTACHVSPVGGGPRTLNGKLFGSRFAARPGPYSAQDLVHLEGYLNYYYPENAGTDQGGLAVMALNVSGNLPLKEDKTKGTDVRILAEHNVGGMPGGSGGPRNAYARIKTYPDTESAWKPQYVLVGRFHAPFGLQTDEHRTYTKVLTKTSWYDFEAGMLLSGNPKTEWHYDLAIVNGEKTAGLGFGAGNAANWGGILNIRYMSPHNPFLFGASYSVHETEGKEKPWATAGYFLLSFDRLTNYRWSAELLLEYVEAQGWNGNLSNWANNAGYVDSVREDQSQGWWAQWTHNINNRWSVLYKYDEMVPDKNYPADYYRRHGFGINYHWPEGALIRLRFENATATHPSENNDESRGGEDVSWLVLKAWI